MRRSSNSIPFLTESERERFFKSVSVHPTPSGCLEWTGSAFENGYGRFTMRGRDERANRVAYLIAHGSVSVDLFVCHHCDNPICVNPNHLYEGTAKQNTQDASRRGRMQTGEMHHWNRNPDTKLTGERHWSKFKPECVARGDRNGARTHPESIRKGEDCGKSKLTEVQVIEIRRLHSAGETNKSIASKFNTVPGNIDFIVQRKTWKHI